jgi:hypothetical protein
MPDTTTDTFAIFAGLFEDIVTLRDFMSCAGERTGPGSRGYASSQRTSSPG